MIAARRQPAYLAALLHRLSGLALAVFLPLHFMALGTALEGAGAFDSFLQATNTPLAKLSEGALVIALAVHLALGLRVLAIEFLPWRERTGAVLAACAAMIVAAGLLFALNV